VSHLSRRSFLTRGAVVACGLAAAGPFEGVVAHAMRPVSNRRGVGYGPLGPVPDLFDGAIRLDLPAGFQYRTFHRTGTVLSDGVTMPARHDGMAAFRGGRAGNTILVRNHEINGPGTALGGTAPLYDPSTMGGTVTLEVDGFGNVVPGSDRVSLRGSQMNCAGGRTPWRAWISCEETVNGDDVGPDFTGAPNTGLLKHGYLFEVPSSSVSDAVPIRAAGRFAKEAAAVTPDGRILFVTEDNFNFASGLYRYLNPPAGNRSVQRGGRRIREGGVLQMLKVVGVDNADLSVGQAAGATYDVEWVTIDDPDPTFPPGTTNDQAIVAVGDQGRALGAAIFSRLEGIHYSKGTVYFTSTQGGAVVGPPPAGFGDGFGQVWAYDVAASTLRIVYESPAQGVLDLPDNVVVSPRRALVLCEDGVGDNFLRGLTRDGQLFDFARNADPTQGGQEFAGATFSPDGRTLFANIQSSSGYSVAIWGPWRNGAF
jgi:secreted PhoX family phosphatase